MTKAKLGDKIILMPSFKFHYIKRLRGFTLIEILIVISIIGVLTGITTVSYTKSQEKTRDTQRKNDLQTIKSALNLYYQQNGKYPPANMAAGTDYYSYNAQPWIPDITPNFINNLPKDPTQTSYNFLKNMLASLQKFDFVTTVYAGGGGGCCFGGGGFGGPPPSATPTPLPTPTPFPTPPPAVGCTAVSAVPNYYCYTVNAQRNRYKIWARLDNTTDSEISTNSTATCFDTSPPASLNYCVESE